MILDLILTKTDDGYTAEVPSLKGCECWSHTEDEALDKILELTEFYLHRTSKEKMKFDIARKEKNKTIYKLIFDK
ncbi:MAG: hypothetical protein Q8903_13140 [Bacteroidota bacterium]|nr:hypothetical protein [Bacteroidota bacterium]